MPLLTSLGLISLALAALSGWVILATVERPQWFRDHGIPAYDGFRKGPRQKRAARVVPDHAAPPVQGPAPEQKPPPAGRRSALAAYADLLGTVPDHVVAAMAGQQVPSMRTSSQRGDGFLAGS